MKALYIISLENKRAPVEFTFEIPEVIFELQPLQEREAQAEPGPAHCPTNGETHCLYVVQGSITIFIPTEDDRKGSDHQVEIGADKEFQVVVFQNWHRGYEKNRHRSQSPNGASYKKVIFHYPQSVPGTDCLSFVKPPEPPPTKAKQAD